jgi:PAS domain S-box-containing protein
MASFIDDVLITEELARRPARSPNYATENSALSSLAEASAGSPATILHKLVETALDLCRADSAGISLLEPDSGAGVFRWHAVAGQWAPHIGIDVPRDASLCGLVLDRYTPLLFKYPERFFDIGIATDAPIVEALFVPFHIDGKPEGSICVIAHTTSRQFDAEDQRLLTSLSRFAPAAITLKRTTAALRESEERVRLAKSTENIGVWDWDLVTGQSMWSPELLEIYGVPPADLLTYAHFSSRVHPDDIATVESERDAAIRNHRPFDLEFRIVLPSGEIRWISARGRGYYDESGRVVRVVGNNIDITERMQAKEALREREQGLRLALLASGAGSWVRDVRTGRVDWDGRFRELCGLPADEPASFHSWLGRVHEEDRAQVLELADQLTHTTTSDTFDNTFRIVRPDGTVAWIQSLGQAHRDVDGQLMRVSGLVLDVTERVLAEEALRENEEREAFLLRLWDTLRPLSDPLAIQEVTARLLGEHLHVNRVSYADIEGTDYIVRLSHASGVAPEVGRGSLAELGVWLLDSFRRGEPIVVNDVRNDSRFSASERAHLQGMEIAALAVVGLVKEEQLVGAVGVHNTMPRSWTETEIELIRDVAERIWEAVERARAEAVMREREQRLSLALEASAAGIWFWEPLTNQVGWDDRLHAQYGFAAGAPRTFDTWISGIHEEDRPKVLGQLDNVVCRQNEWNAVFRVVRPDGAILWMHTLGRAARGPNGQVTRLSGINLDITERTVAEEALRSTEARSREFLEVALRRTDSELRTILKAAPIGIVTMDREGKVTTWNDAAERIFGYKANEVLGRINPAIPDEMLAEFRESMARVLAGATIETESQEIRKDSSVIYVSLVRAPHFDEYGTVKGAITLVEDISEKSKAEIDLARVRSALAEAQVEEARRIARELHDDIGQRLALLSFEIGCTASGPQLSRDQLSENFRSSQQKILEIGEALRQISHRMHPAVLEHLGLGKALEHLCKDFTQREGISVKFHSDELTNDVSRGVGACLYRVAQEALRNVSKHAQAVDVDVKLWVVGQMLQLSIADSGSGFDTSAEKSGLGLHSMRERAESAGGSFFVTSDPGIGTRIVVSVPLQLSRSQILPAGNDVVPPDEHTRRTTKKWRLLIGDDHPLFASGVAKLLDEPYEVVGIVGDGLAAVNAAKKLNPDLVLLDISMPVMNGFEAARQIRRSVPGAKLLFLTTYSSSAYADEAFKSGADGYLVKHAAPSELPIAIATVLRGYQYRSPQIGKHARGTSAAG